MQGLAGILFQVRAGNANTFGHPLIQVDIKITTLNNGQGKLADLVILDANPLTVDPMAIRDIRVLATYKEGRKIYPE